jgi:DNA-binding HxlR family transcriptional regulator
MSAYHPLQPFASTRTIRALRWRVVLRWLAVCYVERNLEFPRTYRASASQNFSPGDLSPLAPPAIDASAARPIAPGFRTAVMPGCPRRDGGGRPLDRAGPARAVHGSHRFEVIQVQTGGTPQMIAARLKKLETDGLWERRLYNERPPRHEYHLTGKGKAFYPVLLALRAWGETWCKSDEEGRAVHFTHKTCGKLAGLGPICESCGQPLRREDMSAELNPAYRHERDVRWAAFKSG